MLFNRLPVRTWSVPALVIIPVAAGVAAGKIAEDFAKQNIVGSSYGFFIGQLRFADMFNRAYRTPGARPTEYPGPIGAKLALASRLNYWLIVVESMGKPNADSLSAEMLSSFASDRLKRKYDISTGAVPSLGSTIHGEIRELCDGVLSDGLFGSANSHCVPSMLARNGYFTRAVHANGSTVYGRDVWYPKIGFAKISASDTEEALRGERSRRWGTKLDGDTIAWTASHAFEHRPSFTYLLTVSTHLPASSLPGTSPSEACLAKSTPHACTHLANLRQVLGQIASAAQDLDDTIVVVVGDHPPPFVSSSSREAFSRTDVPWVMLMPRAQ
jgi:membrane-anchored protein YejM (alkaline phosphatase superfamily)